MSRNTIDKIVAYFSPEKGLKRDMARQRSDILAKNGYDAAGKGRRGSWFQVDQSINSLNELSIPVLRARSREMVRNNPYAARGCEVLVSNTVGTGFIPTAKGPTRKAALANQLMAEWIKACDYSGNLNLYGMQAQIMRSLVESGEVLMYSRRNGDASLPLPMQIQLLEADYIDTSRNDLFGNNSLAQSGIQLDASGRRSGYWLFRDHPGDQRGAFEESQLVPARYICHVYEMLRPGQLRGVPRGVSAFARMDGLHSFQDARIEAQKIAACLVGVVTNDNNDGAKGDVLPDRLEPGMFPELGFGKSVSFNAPPSVSGHAEFVSTELHAIAAAYGITYESMTGDLSGVNFSSARMGWLEMARNIERLRWIVLAPTMLKHIEKCFFEGAAWKGIDLSGVTFDWTPPRREMIDPTKEIPAQIKAIRSGLKSWQETVRENGYTPANSAAEMKEDFEMFDKFGLVLDCDPRQITTAGQMQSVPADVPTETDE
ncbi:MAG: phage portal protein [unclassified Hahellaceae]|nr:phage portal protein [Hahellaceae bacterium]